jgi:hypothetical protein
MIEARRPPSGNSHRAGFQARRRSRKSHPTSGFETASSPPPGSNLELGNLAIFVLADRDHG